MSVPILILAGGASTRMRGRDKLLEEVDGVPLIRRQVIRALTASDKVTVVSRPEMPDRRTAIDDLNVTILEPDEALEGMGGSLRAGVASLDQPDRFLLLLADLVAIGTAEIAQVLAAPHIGPKAKIWRGSNANGEPGHPILFDGACIPHLLTLEGDSGGKAVIDHFAEQVHLVPLPDNRARLDLDTPEDWDKWRESRV